MDGLLEELNNANIVHTPNWDLWCDFSTAMYYLEISQLSSHASNLPIFIALIGGWNDG